MLGQMEEDVSREVGFKLGQEVGQEGDRSREHDTKDKKQTCKSCI